MILPKTYKNISKHNVILRFWIKQMWQHDNRMIFCLIANPFVYLSSIID